MTGEETVHAQVLLPGVFRGHALDDLAGALLGVAPRWSQRVHASTVEGAAGSLIDLATRKSIEGALDSEKARLEALGYHGASASPWFEGSTREFELQVERNDRSAIRHGDSLRLTNSVSLISSSREVEGQPAALWIRLAISVLALKLSPVYGFARTFGEYAWKNKNPPTLRGTPSGLDMSRALPGLYWLNYFGRPYVELIGLEHLLATPAEHVEQLGSGVLVVLSDAPWSWRTPEYRDNEQRALDHIGRDLFFDRAAADRATRAPSLTL